MEKIIGIVMIIVGITMIIVSIVTETYLWIGLWFVVNILGGILFTAMSSFEKIEKINDSKFNFVESIENAFNTGKTVI